MHAQRVNFIYFIMLHSNAPINQKLAYRPHFYNIGNWFFAAYFCKSFSEYLTVRKFEEIYSNIA